MTSSAEERLSSAMHAAVPELVLSPTLADRSRATARRSRRLAVVGAAGSLVVAVAVVGAAAWWSKSDLSIAANPPPDWATCDRTTADSRPAPLVQDAVSIAVCGENDRPEEVPVWIGDATVAQAVVDRLRVEPAGSWIDAYGTITSTPFALLGSDGSVSRFVLTVSSEDGQMIHGNGHAWTVSGPVAAMILDVRSGGPTFVDPPRPFAFDGLTCPDNVARGYWNSIIATPRPGALDRVEPAFDEMVICAYHPYADEGALGPVGVQVGIGHDAGEATRIVGSIEDAPFHEDLSVGNHDAGIAFVILLGSDGELSTVLYAETFGFNVVTDVTPGRAESDRLRPRVVTRALNGILLDAVGRENL